jgi:colanic acid biosynthesis glycosyl transferase WcaI
VPRFLFLTQYFPPEVGAAPVRLQAIARTLTRCGHTVEVVTAMPNYPTGRVLPSYRGCVIARERLDGMRVIRTWIYAAGGRSAVARLASHGSFCVSAFIGLLLARRPDYVFVESPPMFLALTAWLFCRLRRTRYIVNVSDPWLEFARDMGYVRSHTVFRLLERIEIFGYRHAFRVNAVTETIRAMLVERKGVPSWKVAWLPNGVDIDRFRPRRPDHAWQARLGADARPTFVYAGSHQASHGLDVVLDAAQLLGGDIRIVMMGAGTDKPRLMQLAAQHGLTNVAFFDPQPIDAIPSVLSTARAALVVIRGEDSFASSRPAKMLPAMACAKPLVYCGRGEGAAIVERARCGIVVPPGDPRLLANAIRTLADDAVLAQEMGARARQWIEHGSDWREVVERWLAELFRSADRARAKRHEEAYV